MQQSRVKAVFFDLDDTLYDHTLVSRIALAETTRLDKALASARIDELVEVNAHWLEHFHLEVQRGARTLEHARVARWQKIIEHFGGDTSRSERVAAEQRSAYLKNERLIDDAAETLHMLKGTGLQLAIVSNNTREEQLGKLARLGIADFFETVVVSADFGFAKPDVRLFKVALDKLNCDASEVAHVGDSWHADIVGAINADIRAIWFNRFGKATPDSTVREINSLNALPAALEGLSLAP